jgi:hypothetical protein
VVVEQVGREKVGKRHKLWGGVCVRVGVATGGSDGSARGAGGSAGDRALHRQRNQHTTSMRRHFRTAAHHTGTHTPARRLAAAATGRTGWGSSAVEHSDTRQQRRGSNSSVGG